MPIKTVQIYMTFLPNNKNNDFYFNKLENYTLSISAFGAIAAEDTIRKKSTNL